MPESANDIIFEAGERTDGRPKAYKESLRDFYDRCPSPACDNIRSLINEWFCRVSRGKGRRDLHARLGSTDDNTWVGAFWELYLHESLRRAGYELDIEPDVAESENHPDFLARGRGHEFYVEALAVLEDEIRAGERRHKNTYDYLNERPHPNFWLGIQFIAEGAADPPLKRLRHDVTAWLDEFDPDTTPLVTVTEWRDLDWTIELTAYPKSPRVRGVPGGPLLSAPSGVSGSSDLAGPMRERLHEKATRYGRLGKPYLIALAINTTIADRDDLTDALLGPVAVRVSGNEDDPVEVFRLRAGLFMGAGGEQNTRVSGLIVARNAWPERVAALRPAVWLNPWSPPDLRFVAPVPWSHVAIDPTTAQLTGEPSDFDPLAYFGLSPGWPGF
ncbi:MAG: hypothetical protein ACHQ01_09005 [Candidatus Limnocylindrales bacterium]